jgi:hypothetical protein
MFNFSKKTKKEPKSLKEILKQFKALEEKFDQLSLDFKELKKNSQLAVQKVGIIRFNPFAEVGGDQSFSIALLDGYDNGLVVTSFYTREGNRIYAKPIKNGVSQYALSKEEINAIEIAKKDDSNKQNDN